MGSSTQYNENEFFGIEGSEIVVRWIIHETKLLMKCCVTVLVDENHETDNRMRYNPVSLEHIEIIFGYGYIVVTMVGWVVFD